MTSDRRTNNHRERSRTITTSIGTIAVYIKEAPSDQPPVIFLHGVCCDHLMRSSHAGFIRSPEFTTGRVLLWTCPFTARAERISERNGP